MVIKKSIITIIVITLVIAIIIAIELQKPNNNNPIINNSQTITEEEQKMIDTKIINIKKINTTEIAPEIKQLLKKKAGKYKQAPEFSGIARWINSDPLTMLQLKGKVIIIDFWTYSCINCQRTLPYLREWDKKYRDAGLVIIGVHSPEFEFEKKYENVVFEVKKYELKYPIAQDNDFLTWYTYNNRYWPHKFLIDIDGFIVYDHIGEGGYEETEKVLQNLLKERLERLQLDKELDTNTTLPADVTNISFKEISTPEIYFGYKFNRGNFGNDEGIDPEEITSYTMPEKIGKNNAYLSGNFLSKADYMEVTSDTAKIILKYNAKRVNIVAEAENMSEITIYIDDNQTTSTNKGENILTNSTIIIKQSTLYNLINAENYGEHTIRIQAKKGLRIFTFTFG